EQEPGRTGIAVPRLADRARVEQPAVAAERDLRPGRRVAAPELAGVDRHGERNVAVPDEDDRRRRLLECRGGRLVGEDVLPDRVAGAGVEELRAVGLGEWLEPVEERFRPPSDGAARPQRRGGCVRREVLDVDVTAHAEVVISRQTYGGALLDDPAALVRPRPVPDG